MIDTTNSDLLPTLRTSLLFALKSLPIKCKFNLIKLGKEPIPMFPDSVDYTESYVKGKKILGKVLEKFFKKIKY